MKHLPDVDCDGVTNDVRGSLPGCPARAYARGAAVAFGVIAMGEWARRTAAASFAYRREFPLGPSPYFYCERCDTFEIEPHIHGLSLLQRGTSVAVGVTSPEPARVAWSVLPVQHDEDDRGEE